MSTPRTVDLKTYDAGYYGYLDHNVKYTLGNIQANSGGSSGVPGITSTATLTQLQIDDGGLTAGALDSVVVEAQHLIGTGNVELTGLHSYESNDAAKAANLMVGTIYRTSEGHVRVVI